MTLDEYVAAIDTLAAKMGLSGADRRFVVRPEDWQVYLDDGHSPRSALLQVLADMV